jgi:hypothetical protein
MFMTLQAQRTNLLRRIHPALRPILGGVLLFAICNLVLTAGVTLSPLNRKFNFSYGNFLPTKLEMLKQANPAHLDVLFLGTSQTNNGFIPSTFEKASGRAINSFNLGLPNNRYDIMQSCLQAHIQHYGKPKLVLIELGPSIQEKNSYFYYLPALYYRTLIEREPTLASQWLSNPLVAWNVKKELLLSSFSSLYQYRFTFSPINLLSKVSGKLKQLTDRLGGTAVAAESSATSSKVTAEKQPQPLPQTSQNHPTLVITPEMMAKGWYPKDQSTNMLTPDGVRLSIEEARDYYIRHLNEIHFDKLKSLLAYCNQENIPVVLVSWPNHPAFNREFHESPLSFTYVTGAQQLAQATHTPIIDLNQNVPSTFSDNQGGFFADPRHLTPDGADRFSKILAQRLFKLAVVKREFDHSTPQTR